MESRFWLGRHSTLSGISDYLANVDRFGSFAYSVEELDAASPSVRQVADETLDSIVKPQISPVEVGKPKCTGERSEVEIPPGGAVLRSELGGAVSLRRFADESTIEVGTLAPGTPARIVVPFDGARRPWIASIGAGALEICTVSLAKSS